MTARYTPAIAAAADRQRLARLEAAVAWTLDRLRLCDVPEDIRSRLRDALEDR